MLTVFSRKPLFTKNGETFVDLTYPSIRYNYDPYIENAISMNDMLAMRPDLVSKTGYGVSSFWDLLLKYNAISNPFSIGPGDILLIPTLVDMNDQLAPPGTQDVIADSVRKQYIDVSKKAKLDPRVAQIEKKRREAQRKKAQGVGVPSANNLPPNIAEEGDREIIIKGGKVYFGPNITRNKQECETPLSKSEFISRLIKNRLKTQQNNGE